MDARYVLWVLFLNVLTIMGSKAREISSEQPKAAAAAVASEKDHQVVNANSNSFMEGHLAHGSTESRKWTSVLQLHSLDHANVGDVEEATRTGSRKHGAAENAHLGHHHIDPSVLVFFTMKDLRVGKTMPVYFPKREPSSSPHFLPREEADSIPFSLAELPNLLKFFSFSSGSSQAKAMEDTLRSCERKPIKGETKICATSLEAMLDFGRSIVGVQAQLKVISTTHLVQSVPILQNYTITKSPQEVPAPKMVACHTMPYPYALFYCHYQESESKVFKASLRGENGDRVEAVAVCHMDTSQWSRDHVSFRVLGIEPGTSPVCHFFPADNLVWFSSSSAM